MTSVKVLDHGWFPDIAEHWMETSVLRYATKAVGLGPTFTRHAALMETVGCLEWALRNHLGTGSREAFTAYMAQACGWTVENIKRVADEIESKSRETMNVRLQAQTRAATEHEVSHAPDLDQARAVETRIETSAQAWTYAFYRASQALGAKTDTPADLDAEATNEPAPAPKPSAQARTLPLLPGEEPINVLVNRLREKGKNVSIIEACGWSVVMRDAVRAWLEQGGEPPAVLAACAACDRGEPFTEGREYVHTGEGPACRGKQIARPEPEPVSVPAVPTTRARRSNPNVVRPGIPCTACQGSGYDAAGSEPRAVCPVCEGDGKARATCNVCLGAGCDEAGEECKNCDSTGKVLAIANAVMGQLASPFMSPIVPPEPAPGPAPAPASVSEASNGSVKRGRGRPPGAKNKKPTKAWVYAKERALAEIERLRSDPEAL